MSSPAPKKRYQSGPPKMIATWRTAAAALSDTLDRQRLVLRGDDAAEVPQHLLHEVERLQLQRVAADQDRIADEDVAQLLKMPDDEIELFRDPLVDDVVRLAGTRRRRLEQAAASRLQIGADLGLGRVHPYLVRGRLVRRVQSPVSIIYHKNARFEPVTTANKRIEASI